jgi:tRNA(Ile)-lysidine synthase TilS/MesJ
LSLFELVEAGASRRVAGHRLLPLTTYNQPIYIHHQEPELMAKKKSNGVNKSEEIRKLLRPNPKLPAKEVVQELAKKGIKVSEQLVYFQKGKLHGRKRRRRRARQMVAKVAATGNSDPVATILKVKRWSEEVGGLKKLKALVDALSE